MTQAVGITSLPFWGVCIFPFFARFSDSFCCFLLKIGVFSCWLNVCSGVSLGFWDVKAPTYRQLSKPKDPGLCGYLRRINEERLP